MARVALHAVDPDRRLALVRAFEGAPSSWDVFLWNGAGDFDVRVSDAPSSENDICFDPADPQRAVASVGEVLARTIRRAVAVTGARRGCGVTTLALHLAAAWSSANDVALLDLDNRSSLRARLGLPDDARHWGGRDVTNEGRPPSLSAALPHAAGFRLYLAPPDGDGDPSPVVSAAWMRHEFVLVDAPEGDWRDLALSMCSSAILVIPPSHQGIAHARSVLEEYPTVTWSCVVNRLGTGGEFTARHVSHALDRSVSVELPCSPYLRDREDQHRLLTVRWSRYFRRTLRVASALV